MKFPISWHEECLQNNERYLGDERRALLLRLAMYRKSKKDFEFRRLQVETAKAKGMVDFDGERFLKKKGGAK